MTEPEIVIVEDGAALVTTVGAELAAVIARSPAAHLGLTGGTIAARLHEHLGEMTDLDWTEATYWWGDERYVAPDSADRNCLQAQQAWLEPVGVPRHRIFPMPSTDDGYSDLAAAAAGYGIQIRAQGVGEFDVMMLGMGPDGHVASLFPGFPQLDVVDAITVPVANSPKPPPERISLTFPALNQSRQVWLLVSGAEKAEAVARAVSPDADPHTTPASGVHGLDRTVWFLDRAAASLLPTGQFSPLK